MRWDEMRWDEMRWDVPELVVCLLCVFRCVLTSEWKHPPGLGLTRQAGFPSMTSGNPGAASDGLKHRIGTPSWLGRAQQTRKAPILCIYRLLLLARRDRLTGSKVNKTRSCRRHRLNSGFLQVRENWKKSENFSGQGKVCGKYFFGKVRENEKLVPPHVRFSG